MKRSKIVPYVLGFLLAGAVGGVAFRAAQAEPQPHMRKALEALQIAKNQLEKASADKGGHRVKAMALVDQAIDEVKKGIAFDNRN